MAKPWRQVVQDPRFQALSREEQAAAKSQYFEENVAPKLPARERAEAAAQFGSFQPEEQIALRSAGGEPAPITARGLTDAIVDTVEPPELVEEDAGGDIELDWRAKMKARDMGFGGAAPLTLDVDPVGADGGLQAFKESPLATGDRQRDLDRKAQEEEQARRDAEALDTGIGEAAIQTIQAYPEQLRARGQKLALAVEEQVVQRQLREAQRLKPGGGTDLRDPNSDAFVQQRRGDRTAEIQGNLLKAVKEYEDAQPNTAEWSGAGIVSSVLQSAPDTVAALLAGTVGGPATGAAIMFGAAGSEEYGARRMEGKTPDQAAGAALASGVAEGAGEYVPLGYFLKQIKGLNKKAAGTVLSRLTGGVVKEGAGEMLTEALNIGYGVGILDDKMTMAEAVNRVLYSGTVGAAMGGGIQGGIEAARGTTAAAKVAKPWIDKGISGTLTDFLTSRAKQPTGQAAIDAIDESTDEELSQVSPGFKDRIDEGMPPEQARQELRETLTAATPQDSLIAGAFEDEEGGDAEPAAAPAGADAGGLVEPGAGGDVAGVREAPISDAGIPGAAGGAAAADQLAPLAPGDAPALDPEAEAQRAAKVAAIELAANEAAPSPENDRSEPTDGQKEAGNYKVGKPPAAATWGLPLSIENPRGSIRKSKDPKNPWQQELQDHYGYIRGTQGADKRATGKADFIDAFVGENPDSDVAFVVDQVDPQTGAFDEHKVMLGYDTEEQAREAYQRNYAEGWQGLRNISAVPVEDLKQWLAQPQSKPFAPIKEPAAEADAVPPTDTVYHGTGKQFTGDFRTPAFFSKDSAGAQSYARNRSDDETGSVIEAKLDVKKMASPDTVAAVGRQVADNEDAISSADQTALDVIAELKRRGYDSAAYYDQDAETGDAIESYVVFEPGAIKRSETKAPEAETPAAAGETKRRGTVGGKLGQGEVVLTATGRETTPFPKIDTSNNLKATNTVKRVDQWLMDNAIAEAKARGDNFNLRGFEANRAKPQQADKDSAEEYLFGDSQPPVIQSILKPLVPPAEPATPEPAAEKVYPTKLAAGGARAKAGQKETHDLVAVDGGFAVRKKPAVAPEAAAEGDSASIKAIKEAKKRLFDVRQRLENDTWLRDVERAALRQDEVRIQAEIQQLRRQAVDDDVPAPTPAAEDEVITELPEMVPEQAAAPAKKPAVSGNKVFTEDAAEKARALLKKRLGGSTPMSGVDPEILQAGITLAGYHIEKGARTFAAYAKAMVEDLGEAVKPYLKSWYMGVKYDPRAAEFDGMSSAAEVEAFDLGGKDTSDAAVVGVFLNRLREGQGFKSIVDARKVYENITGRKAQGTLYQKRADELLEQAVVARAREIAAMPEPLAERYKEMVALYGMQPNLSTRTSTSVEQQAYSTPAPLAFLASHLAGITPKTTVLEPTAGNGMLLIEAAPGKTTANELNAERAEALRAQGFNPTEKDAAAEQLRHAGYPVDVVIANPPFGAVRDKDGNSKLFEQKWPDGTEFKGTNIDHAIAINSLKAMADGGKAVLIVGGPAKTAKTREARSDAYNGAAKRKFYYNLYRNYRVTDHFTVAGELYEKQGAGWPVDVIVIEGRGPSSRKLPAVDVPRVYSDWEALGGLMEGRNDADRLESQQQPAEQPDRGSADRAEAEAGPADVPVADRGPGAVDGGPIAGTEAGSSDVPAAAGGREPGAAGEREPGRGGRAAGDEQSRPVGKAGRPAPAGKPEERAADREPGRTDRAEPGPAEPARAPAGVGVRPDAVASEGQTQYSPTSKANSIGTLVPRNMSTAIADSLGDLESRVGAIDDYVAKELGYKADEVGNYFSAEQVDALGLALDQMKRGKGFIIGDQTGIGKGRVVAGVIRYALRNGMTPIFVTEKPNLYADMYRDLNDIGVKDIRPIMTNGGESVPLDEEGNAVLKTPAAVKHNADLRKMAAAVSLDKGNMIFTTYSQMQTLKGEATPRMQFIEAFAPNGIVIMDEAHNAGGNDSERKGKKGDDDTSKTGRAAFARQIVGQAKGVFYSSATYAKRPSVMDLYFKTDMAQAVENDVSKLAPAIMKGGVPLQQVVASMLTKAGQYVRRERSFQGVEYNTSPVKVDRAAAERISQIMLAVKTFDDAKQHAVKDLKDQAKADASQVSTDGATGAAGAQSTNFTSIMHNLIDQMLLALKIDAAADRAIAALQAGEKPVITVANTMGSFIAEYAEEVGLVSGDAINLSFQDLLLRYLERSRDVTIKDANGKKTRRRLTDEELEGAGLRTYNAAKRLIKGADIKDVPISPIDWLHHRLKQAGYSSSEITGRNNTVDYSESTPVYRIRPGKETSIAGRRKTITGFNSGTIDAVVLNQAGSTGLSLHASEKFKNQSRRRMIIAQAEKNIDTHMQMLGRVHRTGQVVAPAYDQLVADIPAEKRPAAVLAKKMASLNANTTASRSSQFTSKEVVDFINAYGDDVVAQLMADMPEIHDKLGEPLDQEEGGFVKEEAARKVTGRIPMLPVAEQEELYELIEQNYKETVARAEAMGENALEARTIDLDASTDTKFQLFKGDDKSQSPFAVGADAELIDAKRQGKPYTAEQVLGRVRENLEAPADANHNQLRLLGQQDTAKRVADNLKAVDEYRAAMHKGMAEAEMDEKLMDARLTVLDLQKDRWRAIASNLKLGDTYRIVTLDNQVLYGVVTDVKSKPTVKNPIAPGGWSATFAVADGMRQITVPFSKLSAYQEAEGKIIFTPAPQTALGKPIMPLFDEWQTTSREQRVMVTGNLLAGFSQVQGGQIVNYTTSDGRVQQGILMPKSFDLRKFANEQPVVLTPAQIPEFLGQATNGQVRSADQRVQVTNYPGGYAIYVPKSKSEGAKFFLDEGLRAITGDFISSGGTMRVVLKRDALVKALNYMQREMGEKFQTSSYKDEAKAVGGTSLADAINEGTAKPTKKAEPQAAGRPYRPLPDADVRFDIPAGGTGQTADTIMAEARKMFGRGADNLLERGIVTVVDDVSAIEDERLRDWVRSFYAKNASSPIAFYDPYTSKVYLIANRIEPGEVAGLLLHEVGEHYGLERMLGRAGYQDLLNRVRRLRENNSQIVIDAWNLVLENYPSLEENSDVHLREVLAHIAEDPRVLKTLWWKQLLAKIRQFLFEMGWHRALSDHDLSLVVLASLRKAMNAKAPVPVTAGQLQAAARPGSSAFDRWFGDSKVADAEGKPLVVYHGTRSTDIDAFKPGEDGAGWFAERAETAEWFSFSGTDSTIYPVYLSLQNPLDTRTKAGSQEFQKLVDLDADPSIAEQLGAHGYDGMISEEAPGHPTYLAFRPEQIKSAVGNRGTFDPKNPSILAAARKEAPPPDGGGAAAGPLLAQAEPLDEEVTATGISNARMAEVRERYGFDEVEQEAARSFGQVWAEAEPNTVDGWRRAERLLSELKVKMRPITDTEDAMLLHMSIRLQSELDAVDDQMAELNQTGTQADMLPLEQRRRELAEQLDELGLITKKVGTANARGLNARRMMAARDYSLARLRAKVRAEVKGRQLTKEEDDQLKEMAKRNRELEAEILRIREEKESAEDLAKVVTEAAAEADAADQSKPENQPAARRRRSKDLGKRIKQAIKDGEKPEDYASLIQRLAKSLVAEGVRDHKQLVDGVYRALKDLGAELTRREVQDAISGYGKFTALSKGDVEVAYRQLKGELQLVSKIEDVTAGVPLQRSGMERQEPSDEARALTRQLNEVMKERGVKVTDPATQLKSLLAALKTRLRNQIRDYELALEKRERMTRARKGPPVADDTTRQLQKDLELVRGDYEAMFPVDRSMTMEDRIRLAEAGAERALQRLEQQVALGDIYGPAKAPGVVSDRLLALRARAEAAREELEELRLASPEYQEKKAIKAYEDAADEYERRIRAGELTVDRKPAIDTPATREAKAKRDAARQALDDLRSAAGVGDAKKLERAMALTQAAIDEYNRKIAEADFSTKGPGKAGPTSPELEALQAERDALAKVHAKMKRAAQPKKSPEERALQSLKTRLRTESAKLQERIANRDFTPRSVRKVVMDPEAHKARFERDKLQREFHEMLMRYRIDNMGGGRKIWHWFKEFAGLPRAFQTMLDFSAVLRQGGFIAMGHPIRAAKAIKPMLQATFQGEEAQHRIMEKIRARPNATSGLYDRAGLYLAGENGKLSNKEEVYMNRWIEQIPWIRGFYKGSERAYVTFLNVLRADSFDAMAATLGATKDITEKEAKGIAYFVNNATGRGSVFGFEGGGEAAATIFYSPRYLTSRFAMAAMAPVVKSGSLRASAAVAKEYGRFLLGLAVVYGLAAMAGDDEDENQNDPRSANFGKIKMGTAYIDPMTGLSQVIVFTTRMVGGETVTGKGKVRAIRGDVRYGQDDAFDVGARFLRTKLAPAASIPIDIAAGKNVVGDEVTPGTMLAKSFAPLSVQQIYSVYEGEDVPNKAALMALGLLGVGVQVRED